MASILFAVLLAVVVLAGKAAGTQHQCAHGRFHNKVRTSDYREPGIVYILLCIDIDIYIYTLTVDCMVMH